MSVNIEIHDVTNVRVDDVVRSGSTVWRSIHVTERDGKVVSFTFYAPSGISNIPMTIGGADDE